MNRSTLVLGVLVAVAVVVAPVAGAGLPASVGVPAGGLDLPAAVDVPTWDLDLPAAVGVPAWDLDLPGLLHASGTAGNDAATATATPAATPTATVTTAAGSDSATPSATDGANPTAGASLASAFAVQDSRLENEVERRAIDRRLVDDGTVSAAAVARQLRAAERRLDELERRRAALEAARANGSIGPGAYRVRMARLGADVRHLRAVLDRTERATERVPDDRLAAHGVNETTARLLADRADAVDAGAPATTYRDVVEGTGILEGDRNLTDLQRNTGRDPTATPDNYSLSGPLIPPLAPTAARNDSVLRPSNWTDDDSRSTGGESVDSALWEAVVLTESNVSALETTADHLGERARENDDDEARMAVACARDHLADARTALTDARTALENRDEAGARAHLRTAGENLDAARECLDRAREALADDGSDGTYEK